MPKHSKSRNGGGSDEVPPARDRAGEPTPRELREQLVRANELLDTTRSLLAAERARALVLKEELSLTRTLLSRARVETQRLLEELSDERRSSLRSNQLAEEQRSRLEAELQGLRILVVDLSGNHEVPRHSLVVRRDSAESREKADTVRPPSVRAKS